MTDISSIEADLRATGLQFSYDSPQSDTINVKGERIIIGASPLNQFGYREHLTLSLFGKDISVVENFTMLMNFPPCCRYDCRDRGEESHAFVWNANEPDEEVKALKKCKGFQELLARYPIQKPKVPSANYIIATRDLIPVWEKAVSENPRATWKGIPVADLLPLAKKVLRTSTLRVSGYTVLGLNIVSLRNNPVNGTAVVRFGLEPLVQAEIISREEAESIVSWYMKTIPRTRGEEGAFKKEFIIEGKKYRLSTN